MEWPIWFLDSGTLLCIPVFIGRIYYFLRSIARILIFQVGFLSPLFPTLNHTVFHAPTLVMLLTSEQLEAHSKCMDFSPGQDTVTIDN